jgi:hypothetical protein
MVKKSYGFASTPKPKSAFETYHKDTTYCKMRDSAKEYLVRMLIAEKSIDRKQAEKEAESRLKKAEDKDCGCPRR